ncbi:histone H1-like [Lolium rigidum]|uniref:histone H1-like n=1 Tax=Lolium rigidum TaxID=89674 RepID=UPI001F5E1456|nr:histone H1-like [Lolium rigidum]
MAPIAKPAAAATKPKSSAAGPSHPPYFEMIKEAIEALKDRTGSSSVAIAKYIEEKHGKSLPANFKKMLSVQLRGSAAKGKLVKVKASYKLSDAAKKESPKAKPVAAKKDSPKAKPVGAKAAPKLAKDAAKPKKKAAAAGTKRKTPEKKLTAKAQKSPAAKAKAKPKTVKSPASKKARKVAAA